MNPFRAKPLPADHASRIPVAALALALVLATCPADRVSAATPEDAELSLQSFERAMGQFWDQHGYASYRTNIGDYLVGSPIGLAQPVLSKDRHAPRTVLLQFSSYAALRQRDVAALTNLFAKSTRLNARASPRTVLNLHESVLAWLQLQYAWIIQDCQVALDRPALLFENASDPSWSIAASPGVFSLLVRGPDIEALETLSRRLLAYPTGTAPSGAGRMEGLLPDREAFLQQALQEANLGSAGEAVRRCLADACRNPYERLYWDYALGLFAADPKGKTLFARVCRMSARLGTADPDALYWRLREGAFPDNTECIWPRKKMSRFDPRILAVADAALGTNVVEEMASVQAEIHRRVRAGQLRGGGIAEFTGGRLHGMNDFLDFGVGGCEAFSSFVTAPLLSLGRSGVHPVFISRPCQPWGHWIAGADSAGTLYVCDAESVDFGPPVPARRYIERTMNSASAKDNRYLGLRVYSQTLASWEWEYLLEGANSPTNVVEVVNPIYATYSRVVRRAVREPR